MTQRNPLWALFLVVAASAAVPLNAKTPSLPSVEQQCSDTSGDVRAAIALIEP